MFALNSSVIGEIQSSLFKFIGIILVLQVLLHIYYSKLGRGAKRFYKHNSLVIFFALFLYLLSFVLLQYIYYRKIDPFYAFTDFCVLCKGVDELFLTFARVSFWLVGLAAVGIYYRKHELVKDYSRILQYLYYPSVLLVLGRLYFVYGIF